MKRPDGSGGVRKLSGRRRHPYQAVASAGHVIRNNKICVRQISLGCYATRKEALEALAEWQVNHLRIDLRYMTVHDVWLKIRPTFKDSMGKGYDSLYKKYAPLHKKRLIDIRTCDIEQIPLPTLSATVHSKIRSMWHAIFEYGIANDIVSKDYSKYIKFKETSEKKSKSILSPDEIKKCIDIPIYRFLLYTGMRINELLDMETEQIYEEDGILCFHIVRSKTASGIRTIPVHSELMSFINLSNRWVIDPKRTYESTRLKFSMFANENGMENHTLHDFRRTFASYAQTAGADPYYVKCLMGHIHHDITKDVYTQAFISDLKREIEKVRYL